MVEAAIAPTFGGGRRPGDDVGDDDDRRGHGGREAGERTAVVAVLQTGDELAGRTLVREQRDAAIDAERRRQRRGRSERARAAAAEGHTTGAATWTRDRQEHDGRISAGRDGSGRLPPVIEHVATESPTDPASRAIGLVLAIALAAIVGFIMILMAFSTTNTPMSVDGDRATYSHNLESDSGK